MINGSATADASTNKRDLDLRIIYLASEERLVHEFVQSAEEGKSVASLRADWNEFVSTDPSAKERDLMAEQLLDALALTAGDPERERDEPSVLADIWSARKRVAFPLTRPVDVSTIEDRIHGGWLGRAAGCLLGKPVEKSTREGIRQILESSGQWPLRDYVSARGVPDALVEKYPWNRYGGIESLKENIVCMPEDDDLNYSMVSLHILERFGSSFSSEDVLQTWLETLPVLQTFTAERIAYLNALELRTPPETATYRNPYREWIGALIRADVWGWVSPGNPDQAARLAWRDASVSHVKNGIYGEMFVAAAVAACFSVDHPLDAIRAGMDQIPRDCRLAEAIRYAIQLPEIASDWEDAVDKLHARYGHYHWVHTVNNAALLTAAIAFGDGDYEQTICNAVMGGWDTDSHGATVGSILGTWLGAKRLPEKWTTPLQNTIRTSMKGFDHSTFDDLARRTVAQIVD